MAGEPYRIPLEELVSSNLAAGGYDASRRILAIKFKSGIVFHYAGVGQTLATEFYLAESKGKFYATKIRGKFEAERMTGQCPKCGDLHGYIGDVCDDCGTERYAAVPYERKPKGGDDASPA